MAAMDQKEALAELTRLYKAEGVGGIKVFAAKRGVRWETVYGWYRRNSVPQWRVQLFKKRRAA